MDPTKRCFSIEREGDLVKGYGKPSLASFKEEFVFLFARNGSKRYSLAEDKFEKLPMGPSPDYPVACTLGDKVYMLCEKSRFINVLHNPDAPVSSQEMHWQVIKVPGNILFPRHQIAWAPLNSTEIISLAGSEPDYEEIY